MEKDWLPAAHWLRSALVAGLAAALIAGMFNLTVSERVLDRAIQTEEARADQSGEGHALAAPAPFTRSEQRRGLAFSELLRGISAALVLSGVAILLRPHGLARPQRLWFALVGTALWAVVLLPWLKYPPLPPGAPSTLGMGERQSAYLVLVASGLIGAGVAGWVLRIRPGRWGIGRRALLASAGLASPPMLAFLLLPAGAVQGEFPDDVMTNFRVVSLISQVLFWLTFALVGTWLLRTRGSG